MEEGSLLQEALSRASTAAGGGFGGPQQQELLANNTLVVDVYLLPLLLTNNNNNNNKRIQYLLQLASIGVQLNQFIQSQHYPWMSGGDGPVFGIHLVSSSSTNDGSDNSSDHNPMVIPCLRCCCRYGVSVQDEWKLIALVLEFSSSKSLTCQSQLLAIECWDEDDGQVLLIESANVLPNWVDDDDIGPELCRHRCWIVNGQVHLIEPKTEQQSSERRQRQKQKLSLRGALRLIEESSSLARPNQQVTAVIRETLKRRKVDNVTTTTANASKKQIDKKKKTNDPNNKKNDSYYHKTVMVLPRSLACLIQNRPDLVNVACQSFVDNASQHNILCSSKTKAEANDNHYCEPDPSLCGTCEDWVWTTFDFGKTQYAMMRTFLSNPAWKTESTLPPIYNKSIELKRLKRQSTIESSPHLHHAVPLGVRLVAGFDYLLLREANNNATRTEEEEKKKTTPTTGGSHTETRVLDYWNRIDRAFNNNNGDNNHNNWLLNAWQAGPNHSEHNIESVMKCPVYDPEICDSNTGTACTTSCTPLSHPQETLASQIRRELLRKSNDADDDENNDNTFFRRYPPGPSDVDTEEWMTMPDEEELRKVTSPIELMETAIDDGKSAGQTKEKNGNNNNKDGGDSKVLDEMLCGVQSFMKGQSTVEGVETATAATTTTKMPFNDDNPSSVDINPTVFLNILHATLKAQSSEELNAVLSNMGPTTKATPSADPFFSERDYEMEEDSSSSGSGDDDDNNDLGEDTEMTELMQAMDQELLRSSQSISRSLDGDAGAGAAAASPPSEEVTESTHLLTNLLQSLDAGAGGPGPVQNILKEMGIQPPK